MFLLLADSLWCLSAFWHDQCHNPHAHEYAELYEEYEQHLPSTLTFSLHELARGETVRASQNLPNAWARAFGALRDTCIWSSGSSWRCPDDVPVLVLGPISYVRKYVNNTSLLMTDVPVLASSTFRAQVHAFRCIRAAALARWLRAVGVVMSRAQWAGMANTAVIADITDIILFQLASWHAALQHDEALPRRQPWL
jgi:hypothetical protein